MEPLRIARVGVVGVGSRGTYLLQTMLQIPGVEAPAICDTDADHARQAQEIVEKAGGRRPEAYTRGGPSSPLFPRVAQARSVRRHSPVAWFARRRANPHGPTGHNQKKNAPLASQGMDFT